MGLMSTTIKPLAKLQEYKWNWHCQLCPVVCPELRDVWPHLHIDHKVELSTLRLNIDLDVVYSSDLERD